MPNYNQYKIFCSVAQQLSMTKAAEEKTTKVIATTHTFLNDFLLPNTELLRKAFPNAIFRIETCSMSEVQDLVLSGKADIGLILMDGKEAEDLVTYPIRIIRELFATRDSLISQKEVLPAEKILDYQLVTIHSDSKSFAFYQNHAISLTRASDGLY